MFYDCHIHNVNNENGGFLVGLEGEPYFEGTLNNSEVSKLQNENYIAFFYVTFENINKKLYHKYLKYHPRREKYTPDEVIESIKLNNPKCVMIDTLNEPYWIPYDYWDVARKFPDLFVIFPHAGGYLINDFIKICHFQKNVWLDFSLTHTTLGQFGNGLQYITDGIKYVLKSPFKNRILMGSDYPFFSQDDVVKFYRDLNVIELLNSNFKHFKECVQ